MADNPFPLDRDRLLTAYRTMRTIREFEERLHVDFARGDIPGFVHLYAGEEAAGTGIMMHLRPADRIASTHRGHGHCIAKGVDPRRMMKEIYGRKGGSCEGKGGSMHIAELDVGMMGANGILAGARPGLTVVDTTTISVSMSRKHAQLCREKNIDYLDAPVSASQRDETAGTLTAAAKILRDHGARRIRAAVSHCILNEVAIDRLKSGIIDLSVIAEFPEPPQARAVRQSQQHRIAHALLEAGPHWHGSQALGAEHAGQSTELRGCTRVDRMAEDDCQVLALLASKDRLEVVADGVQAEAAQDQ